jgi:hypothetical protein
VDIDPLCVFQQSPHQGLRVVDVDDTGWQGKYFRNLSGAESSCSCHDLEAFGVGAHGDWLNETVGADALGIMFRKRLCGRCGFPPHG